MIGWSKFDERHDAIDCSRPIRSLVSDNPHETVSSGPEPSVTLMAPPSPVAVPSRLMSAKLVKLSEAESQACPPPNQHRRPSWNATDVGQPATSDHWLSTQFSVPISEENVVAAPMPSASGGLIAAISTVVGDT